jgi:uncharacterized protein YndB with AHSA1/START domain
MRIDLQSLGCMSELTITRTVHIGAHRSAVWAAITQPELISEWFGDRAELDLRPGGVGSLGWDAHGTVRLVVEEVDEPNAFAFRWARDFDVDPTPGASTLVRFTLSDRDGGTELTVVESGWEDVIGNIEQGMADNTVGWHSELDELVAFLEKQDSA